MKLRILILSNNEVDKYDGLRQSILSMNGRLDLSNRSWFIIWNGKNWLGFGGYREIDNERIYFGPTFIKEEFRGMGLQLKLIRARLAKAKEEGYQEAISSIFAYNYKSGNNLIKAGFTMTPIPRYYDIEVDEVWFKKRL